MGDDRAFEYIYKFVSASTGEPFESRGQSRPARPRHAVCRAVRCGRHGRLASAHARQRQAHGRRAASRIRRTCSSAPVQPATRWARRRWTAPSGSRSIPRRKEVYCTLTNNATRGVGKGGRAPMPRIRARTTSSATSSAGWKRAAILRASRSRGTSSRSPAIRSTTETEKQGNLKGAAFGSPDGLWIDDNGLLWIQTDVSTSTLNRGHYERLGNNQMLCADPKNARDPALPHRPARMRGDGHHRDARRPHVLHQHPASRRELERAQRSRESESGEQLARRAEAAGGHAPRPSSYDATMAASWALDGEPGCVGGRCSARG